MRLIIRKPADAVIDGGGYIHYSEPWTERAITRSVIKDMTAVSDDGGLLFLVRKYGRFFPPDVYPAGEPVETALDWCQTLPAAITVCQCIQWDKPVPATVQRLFARESTCTGLVRAVQGVFDDVLRLTGSRPFLYFDTSARRFDMRLAAGKDGRVSCLLAAAVYFAMEQILDPSAVFHVAECSLCHRLFEPRRKPQAGRAAYCDRCRGSAEMWRVLKRRQRSRAD